jgi:hypothetical protein
MSSVDSSAKNQPLDAFDWWKHQRKAKLCTIERHDTKEVNLSGSTSTAMSQPPGGRQPSLDASTRCNTPADSGIIAEHASRINLHVNDCSGGGCSGDAKAATPWC